MLKTIAIVAVSAVTAVLVYAYTRPDDFRVQRSTSIKAPPDRIVPFIHDFHAWGAWSPWEKIDPDLKRTFSGAPSGKGAVYAWESTSSKVGTGRMEIMESSPARVAIKLDFLKPFEAHNTAEFTLVPAGDATTVTWAMSGPRPFISKLMGLVFNMDTMIGGAFETGLANLKAATEK